jgi:hypothetical protein
MLQRKEQHAKTNVGNVHHEVVKGFNLGLNRCVVFQGRLLLGGKGC